MSLISVWQHQISEIPRQISGFYQCKNNQNPFVDSATKEQQLSCYWQCANHRECTLLQFRPTALLFWPRGGQHRSCFGHVWAKSAYVLATCGPTALMFWPRVDQQRSCSSHVGLQQISWHRKKEKCIKTVVAGLYCRWFHLAWSIKQTHTSRDTYINLELRLPTILLTIYEWIFYILVPVLDSLYTVFKAPGVKQVGD